jgi:aminoglycoside phosphotransferase (APT) family kinase protein
LLARYEEQSGQSSPDFWFYVAFNVFKSCCIVQGVYARFVGGVRGTQGEDVDVYRDQIRRLARATTSAIGLL